MRSGCNPEIRNRIRVSVAAYAYEFLSQPVMSDAEYDELADKIDLKKRTGNVKLDLFFWKNFEPFTGQWVLKHPDLSGLHNLYVRYYTDPAENLI